MKNLELSHRLSNEEAHDLQKNYRLLCAAINRIKATEDKRNNYDYSLSEVTDLMSALNDCYRSITFLMSVYSELQYILIKQESINLMI